MKHRVLIIPNVSGWIIGEMAQRIIQLYQREYTFYYLSELVIRRRPDLAKAVLEEVDFVHAMMDSSAQWVLAQPNHPPLLTWMHHFTSWTDLHTDIARNTDHLIATTAEWASRIRRLAGLARPIYVIRYGVDTLRFKPMPVKREQFAVPTGSFCIGFMGAKPSDDDNQRKGIDVLLAVASKLRDRLPALHLSFAGLGWQPVVEELRLRGISAHTVEFLPGHLLPTFFSCLDVYLVTSRVEGGPVPVLQAMACTVPVVATRVGLVPDAIQDGVNGFSAAVGDVEELVDRVLRIAGSREQALVIGQNARRTVEDGWRWEQVLARLEEPYNAMRLLAKPARLGIPSALRFQAEELINPVCIVDALIWSLGLVRRGVISPLGGFRMLSALWHGFTVRDIANGLLLLTKAGYTTSIKSLPSEA